MNRSDGIIFKSFDFIADDFKVFFTYVIGLNETDKKLYYYDIDGYVVYKTRVNVSEHVQILTDGQERILFFDPSMKSVWF